MVTWSASPTSGGSPARAASLGASMKVKAAICWEPQKPLAVEIARMTEDRDDDREVLRLLVPKLGAAATVVMSDTRANELGIEPLARVVASGVSALDPECRFRGLENLYVVDGSVMPTSAAVNPSLTIAANALRAAHRLAGHSSLIQEPASYAASAG